MILLALVGVSAVIVVRLLLDVAPTFHRQTFSRTVKYIFLIGMTLGITAPWNEQLALTAAATANVTLLLLAVYYYLLGGRRGLVPGYLGLAWLPKKTIKSWFQYFAMMMGIVGVSSSLFSLTYAYLLNLNYNSLVPVSFSSNAILSSMLGFTIRLPPYNTLHALLYRFLRRNYGKSREAYIHDIDFRDVLEGTQHTEADLRDALEMLVAQGHASKQSPAPLGQVIFRIGPDGLSYLKFCTAEIYSKLTTERRRIDATLLYIKGRLANPEEIEMEVLEGALSQLNRLKADLRHLQGLYGPLLPQAWVGAANQTILTLEQKATTYINIRRTKAKTRPHRILKKVRSDLTGGLAKFS
jgi:hypothetical protein